MKHVQPGQLVTVVRGLTPGGLHKKLKPKPNSNGIPMLIINGFFVSLDQDLSCYASDFYL